MWRCLFPSTFDSAERSLLLIYTGQNNEKEHTVIDFGYQTWHGVLTPFLHS